MQKGGGIETENPRQSGADRGFLQVNLAIPYQRLVAADGRLTLAGVKTSADLVQSGNARVDRDGDNTGRGMLG